jgi:hypothetical protein
MKPRFIHMFAVTVAAVAGSLNVQLAPGAIVASHAGDTDPTTEGWTTFGPGSAVVVGAVNDGGTLAWMVNDTSTATNTHLFYRQPLTSSQASDADTNGWILSTTLRVLSSTRPQDSFSPSIYYYDGTTNWTVGFNVVSGDTVVQLVDGYNNFGNSVETTLGPTYTIPGNSSYNRFELRFDPVSSTADLFVNGVERLSDYGGIPDGKFFGPPDNAPQLSWGTPSPTDSGHGNFQAITFAIIPEPSALALMLLSLGAWYTCRRS